MRDYGAIYTNILKATSAVYSTMKLTSIAIGTSVWKSDVASQPAQRRLGELVDDIDQRCDDALGIPTRRKHRHPIQDHTDEQHRDISVDNPVNHQTHYCEHHAFQPIKTAYSFIAVS